MFFTKKDKQVYQNSLQEILTAIKSQENDVNELRLTVDRLQKEIGQAGRNVKEHNMVLEDTLEAVETHQQSERHSEKAIRQLEEENEQMRQLLMAYQEHFWRMGNLAGQQDGIWAEQFRIAAESINLQAAGLSVIDDVEVKVDYDVHEVLEARITAEPMQHQKVASVYSPGFRYRGKVLKKAKVAAYKYEQPNEGEGQNV